MEFNVYVYYRSRPIEYGKNYRILNDKGTSTWLVWIQDQENKNKYSQHSQDYCAPYTNIELEEQKNILVLPM